jgi:hypothetical protein
VLLNSLNARQIIKPQWVSLYWEPSLPSSQSLLASYTALVEHFGVTVMQPVEERDGVHGFEIVALPDYHALLAAVERELLFCTERHDVDYPASVTAWREALNRKNIPRSRIDRIRSNDLSLPCFEGFDVTMMNYLLTCKELIQGVYRRADDFVA